MVPDNGVVILSAVRTAQARFQGGFAATPAVDLAATVMREALRRAGVQGDQLSEIIFGNVIQAGQGQNPARQAALRAGIPDHVPAMTVNRVCVSSSAALVAAANAIAAGDGDVFLVGGMENMTRAPWLLPDMRSGCRMGMPDDKVYDAMVWDALWCAIGDYHMGVTAENLSRAFSISREEQDRAALLSQMRAEAALDSGRFIDEVVPVLVPQRRGESHAVTLDECPRRGTTMEALAQLRPFFVADGSVTAGNSSAIADGASALVVASRRAVAGLGLSPIAELISHATIGVAPDIMGLGAVRSAQAALDRAGLASTDVDLAEFNEAFACVSVLATRELRLDPGIVNVNGGAIALGHPVGSSGTRIIVTLIHELRRRGKELGLASACVGGGQGAGVVIRVLN
ncbi:MAG: acetyl-CoA C-acyltransferase [Thermoleophilia bacterium]